MATDDPVGVTLGGIAAGAVTGAAVIAAGVLALRSVQQGGAPAADDAVQFAVLTGSVLAGLVMTVVTTVVACRPIEEVWRRGVAAAIAVFGTVLLASATAPADIVAGRAGIAAYLALLLASAFALHRRRRRRADS